MTKDDLISNLMDAFREVSRDEEFTLHQAQLADQSLAREISEREFAATKKLDPEQNWYEIPASYIDECDAALSHISPAGWRFCIPAYMKRSIDLIEDRKEGHDLPDLIRSVIFHLTYPEKDVPMQLYVLDRFKTLNEKQADAVASFLKFVTGSSQVDEFERNEAKVALNRYWGLTKDKRPSFSILVS